MITASWHLAFPLLIFLAWGNCRLFVPNIVAGSHIREKDFVTPIIAIADYHDIDILVSLVKLSTDGYLIKPFSVDELIEAIKVAMKRNKPSEMLIPLGGDVFYNHATREIYSRGIPVVLGSKEHALFRLLIENHPRTTTKEELVEKLWPMDTPSASSIKNLILRLRVKIGIDIFITVRGVGYRLNIDDNACGG